MVQPNQGGSRKISFNVSDQYDIQDVIGEGAYGVVWSVSLLNPTAWIALTFVSQLCPPQAIWTEGRDQEDYAIRPFYVLPPYPA